MLPANHVDTDLCRLLEYNNFLHIHNGKESFLEPNAVPSVNASFVYT